MAVSDESQGPINTWTRVRIQPWPACLPPWPAYIQPSFGPDLKPRRLQLRIAIGRTNATSDYGSWSPTVILVSDPPNNFCVSLVFAFAVRWGPAGIVQSAQEVRCQCLAFSSGCVRKHTPILEPVVCHASAVYLNHADLSVFLFG